MDIAIAKAEDTRTGLPLSYKQLHTYPSTLSH